MEKKWQREAEYMRINRSWRKSEDATLNMIVTKVRVIKFHEYKESQNLEKFNIQFMDHLIKCIERATRHLNRVCECMVFADWVEKSDQHREYRISRQNWRNEKEWKFSQMFTWFSRHETYLFDKWEKWSWWPGKKSENQCIFIMVSVSPLRFVQSKIVNIKVPWCGSKVCRRRKMLKQSDNFGDDKNEWIREAA